MSAVTSYQLAFIAMIYLEKDFLFGPLENKKPSRVQDQIPGSAFTLRNTLICTRKSFAESIQNTIFSI